MILVFVYDLREILVCRCFFGGHWHLQRCLLLLGSAKRHLDCATQLSEIRLRASFQPRDTHPPFSDSPRCPRRLAVQGNLSVRCSVRYGIMDGCLLQVLESGLQIQGRRFDHVHFDRGFFSRTPVVSDQTHTIAVDSILPVRRASELELRAQLQSIASANL